MYPTEKLACDSTLLYVQNRYDLFFSRSVKINRSPGCSHQATTVEHLPFKSPEPLAIRMLWKTTEKKNMAAKLRTLIIAVKRCGRFILTGKSVLFFKSSGKVKSK